ncbi:hypothetical protein PLICRDRAFT_38687 [Plicaturopsis crispa FD-325 SS-3]|nr:hypothetical protein PLICRDRAFT_38687 [Plicaturopsis crispa FD-325 SS-3]
MDRFASRPPPPQGPPPSYAFVNRVYQHNLRPMVIGMASISALWTLLLSIDAFRESTFDKSENVSSIATITLVLGIMYIVACIIEIFGLTAAALNRLALIRMYAFLSGGSALLVIAGGFLTVVTHFTKKSDLLTLCNEAISDVNNDSFRWGGIFGPSTDDDLTPGQASDWCNRAFTRTSWSCIVSLLVEIVLGLAFTIVAWSYYRQCLNPALTREHAVPAYAPAHYAPAYAPPPGPPPHLKDDDAYYQQPAPMYGDGGKPPGYAYGDAEDSFVGATKDGKEDPFADYDGPSDLHDQRERDVTSPGLRG